MNEYEKNLGSRINKSRWLNCKARGVRKVEKHRGMIHRFSNMSIGVNSWTSYRRRENQKMINWAKNYVWSDKNEVKKSLKFSSMKTVILVKGPVAVLIRKTSCKRLTCVSGALKQPKHTKGAGQNGPLQHCLVFLNG